MSTLFHPLFIFTDGTSQGKAGYTGAFMLIIETPEYSAQQAEILTDARITKYSPSS